MLTPKKNGPEKDFFSAVLRRHDDARKAWGTIPLRHVLRQQRESRKLSLPEAARVTGIPVKYLHLLERADDEQLGTEPLSLITSLRRYATFLKLNPDVAVAQFLAELEQVAPLETAGSGAPQTQLLKPLPRLRSRVIPRTFLLLVALGLLVCVVAYSALQREQRSNGDRSTSLPPPSSPAPAPQAGAPLPAASPAPFTSPAAEDQPRPSPPPPAAAPAVVAAPQNELPSSAPHHLRIQTKAKTWLHVTIDEQPMQRLFLLTGRSLEWSAEKGFILSLGNAGAVKLILDGRELPPLGKAGQMALNVRLPSHRGEQKQEVRKAERLSTAQPR
jgi:hypothetical protein